MKKLLFAFLFSPLFINPVFADNLSHANKTAVVLTKSEQKAKAKMLVGRLYEIKSIVKHTQLTAFEKKNLRTEVQSIQQQLEKMEGVYLYLSLTTILIILLLILLL